jgi:hypothetical protein
LSDIKWQAYIKERVQIDPASNCWNWQQALSPRGYGMASYVGRKKMQAHRLSFTAFVGSIPEGLLVRHLCHNKRCCNPEHLRPGTEQDNADDETIAGHRSGPDGAQNGMARLTAENVREMRRDHATGRYSQRELAAKYGTTSGQVNAIVNGKSWKHVR